MYIPKMRNMVWGSSYSNQVDSFTEFFKEICLWKSSLTNPSMHNFILSVLWRGHRSYSSQLRTKHQTKALLKVNLCVHFVATCSLAHTTFYPAQVAADNPCRQKPLPLPSEQPQLGPCPGEFAPAQLHHASTPRVRRQWPGQGSPELLSSVGKEWDG